MRSSRKSTATLMRGQRFFVETVLPRSVIRPLCKLEMDAYRKPFLRREARLPTLVWPRELPIEGEPADVVAAVEHYGARLAQAPLPKLFINAEPGALLTDRAREFCRRWPNQREVSIGGTTMCKKTRRRRSAPR